MIQEHSRLETKISYLRMCMWCFISGVIFLGLLISGCTPEMPSASLATASELAQVYTAIPEPTMTLAPVLSEIDLPFETQSSIILTYPNLDGNRLVQGAGFVASDPIDIQLLGKPIWLLAAALQDQSVWVVVLESGQVQTFRVDGKTVVEEQSSVPFLPVAMPPALVFNEGQLTFLLPASDATSFTNPLLLEDGSVVYIGQDGQLYFAGNDEFHVLATDVLPDARILSDGSGRLMFLSAPSDHYPHGIMGDEIEATEITIIDTSVDPFVVQEIRIASGDVIEGLAPIWADLDGDGRREIIVTQSNATDGSRIVVYREDGSVLAEGTPIGQGFRWIHQVAVGQFIAGGSLEIATVRTPHIGGVVEIYALDGDQLVVVDSLSGYSSHRIGSRNLDSALAGDFDGDGMVELVVPNQAQTVLYGVQFSGEHLDPVWNVAFGGRLNTNLAGVELADGRLALGAGTEDHLLRIWIP